ncbi:MAG: LysM peptidoglycan-binding domain-containing protein [Phycisphaerae bacterium]
MRTDVKIALVAAIVLIILVVVYIELRHSSKRAVLQNTAASSAPPLVQSNNPAPSPDNSLASSQNPVGGAASVPLPTPATMPTTGPATTAVSPSTSPTTSPAGTQPSVGTVATDTSSTSQGLGNNLGVDNSISDNSNTGGSGATSDNSSNSGLGLGNNSGGGISSSGGTGINTGTTPSSSSGSGSGGRHYYRIRQGDTLVGISRAVYGTPGMVTAIEAANPGLSARDLRIGQRIRLPRKNRHTAGSHRAVGRRHHSSRRGRVYIVRSGDDLYSIARHVYHDGADWKLIYRANRRKIGPNPAHIFIGERLYIPAR